jgi:hypothetical protein
MLELGLPRGLFSSGQIYDSQQFMLQNTYIVRYSLYVRTLVRQDNARHNETEQDMAGHNRTKQDSETRRAQQDRQAGYI